ncbi:hypothetical protein J437_LFUL002257 [Ladona fulva]|uniref:Uncharacterized protein n=1 Tax=Ladona fulva TaxID=123851 RepID=A0A8K0NWR7_LADFU|nr:hypothetical protein J437_LFUL002257 [Ladona fulva]
MTFSEEDSCNWEKSKALKEVCSLYQVCEKKRHCVLVRTMCSWFTLGLLPTSSYEAELLNLPKFSFANMADNISQWKAELNILKAELSIPKKCVSFADVASAI